ncbi:MAG: hypothetical protein U9N59_10325 [Campylobacterota bacterium]|nr:hypothetical protein [Campylobacterota bacterium]
MRSGRWTGYFENPNTLADTALMAVVLSFFYNSKKAKYLFYISAITIIISTSKHAIGILLLFIVIKYYKNIFKINIKFLFLSVVFLGLITTAYLKNEKDLQAKSTQIDYFLSNTDVLLNLGSSGAVDHRFQSIAIGLHFFFENFPAGTGLGTWGDASSKFNSKQIINEQYYTPMSDTALFHLLVEQGIWLFVYFLLLLFPFFFIDKTNKFYFLLLMTFYFLTLSVTMGLSSSVWPYLFSYLYARIFYSKDIKKLKVHEQ